MCGRYSLSSAAQLVRETFVVEESTVEVEPRWNIAPTQDAPVVRLGPTGRRRLDLLRWGLIPEKADSPGAGPINARSETASTTAAFRDAFRARRCLIPANGFYEWLKLEGSRHPFHIRAPHGLPMAFAGLWGRWKAPGRPGVESFAILTCPPIDLIRPLHDRMPVILPPETWDAWLDPRSVKPELQALLVPWHGDELESVPVSPFVNRTEHEGPECVREVSPPAPRQLSLLPP